MSEVQVVDRQKFRDAMSRLGAAVNIITATGPTGDVGMTASAVCSVTDDPATVLVCINRNSRLNGVFKAAGALCVNVLSRDQTRLSALFAGVGDVPMPDRFAADEWLRLATGAPVLKSAAASLDCHIDQVLEVGTHSVFFCAVQAIHIGDSHSGLIYHGRAYHQLGAGA